MLHCHIRLLDALGQGWQHHAGNWRTNNQHLAEGGYIELQQVGWLGGGAGCHIGLVEQDRHLAGEHTPGVAGKHYPLLTHLLGDLCRPTEEDEEVVGGLPLTKHQVASLQFAFCAVTNYPA